MKLQVRKTYKTRAGDKVKIKCKYDSENFLGSNKAVYRSSGRFSDRQECDIDLIEEL